MLVGRMKLLQVAFYLFPEAFVGAQSDDVNGLLLPVNKVRYPVANALVGEAMRPDAP